MLLAAPGVSGMVADRVYLRRAPQGAPYPLITYSVQTDPGVVHDGREKLDRVSLSVDCYARDAPGAPASVVCAQLAQFVVDGVSGSRFTHGDWQLSFGFSSTYEDGLEEDTGIYSVAVELSGWARSPQEA